MELRTEFLRITNDNCERAKYRKQLKKVADEIKRLERIYYIMAVIGVVLMVIGTAALFITAISTIPLGYTLLGVIMYVAGAILYGYYK